jgi:hypothetical protein
MVSTMTPTSLLISEGASVAQRSMSLLISLSSSSRLSTSESGSKPSNRSCRRRWSRRHLRRRRRGDRVEDGKQCGLHMVNVSLFASRSCSPQVLA